jgi:hypothetical protein
VFIFKIKRNKKEVYYESMKRKPLKPIYECRCNGRLQTERFTRKDKKRGRAVKVFFFPGTNPARGENGKLHHEKKMERG